MYGDLYCEAFKKYMSQNLYYGFNCFIVKREYFYKMSEVVFNIAEKIGRDIDDTYYSEHLLRYKGYISEILNGFLIWYFENFDNVKVEHVNLVYFDDTQVKKIDYHNNSIPIAIPCSDYYVPYVFVLIKSILDKSKGGKKFHFVLLTKNISESNKKKLDLLNSEGITLDYYDASMFFSKKLFVSSEFYSDVNYYRCVAPWILSQYDKIIIMDADIVAVGDISELYEINIDDYCAAAVKDYVYQGFLNSGFHNDYDYAKNIIGLDEPYDYVNTGVMLLNCKKIRNEFSIDSMLQVLYSNEFRIQEQDALNKVFQEKIKFLPLKYNYYTVTNIHVANYINLFAPAVSKKDYYESRRDAVLIHYASQPKPWSDTSISDADLFWKVARNTPFYETILLRNVGSDNIQNALTEHIRYHKSNDPTFQTSSIEAIKKEIKRFCKIIFPYGSKGHNFLKKIYIKYKPFVLKILGCMHN